MNGRFDTLQAAVLLAKLPHFNWELQGARPLGARYSGTWRATPCPPGGAGEHPCLCPIHHPPAEREAGRAFKRKGYPTAVYYPKCLHEQPVFAELGFKPGDFPESERASREVLSLPMHPFLAEADQDKIIATVKKALSRPFPARCQAGQTQKSKA